MSHTGANGGALADGPAPTRAALFHEFWRMQLLDELHRKLDAFEWEPVLDPRGSRRAALEELIDRFEAFEALELANRSQAPEHAHRTWAQPNRSIP